jgi:hypothetical protein
MGFKNFICIEKRGINLELNTVNGQSKKKIDEITKACYEINF